MRVKTRVNRMLLGSGAFGPFGRSVVGLRLEIQTAGCVAATPIWEVLK